MTVHYARVAVNVPLHQLFTYAVPEGERAEPGCRVRVPFGPRRLVGVVVEQTRFWTEGGVWQTNHTALV